MVWDGSSLTRQSEALRAPDGHDWQRSVAELQLAQMTFEAVAGERVDVGQVVRLLDSRIVLATPSVNSIVGIVCRGGVSGQKVVVKLEGLIKQYDWTVATGAKKLDVGLDYFLVQSGRLSTSPPSTGWVHKLGQALSPQEFAFLRHHSVRL